MTNNTITSDTVNNCIYKFGGRIGRKRYFLNSLIIFAIALIPGCACAVAVIYNMKILMFFALFLAGIMVIILFIFNYTNDLKRYRDIVLREISTLERILLLFTYIIPLFMIIKYFLLQFLPHKKSQKVLTK